MSEKKFKFVSPGIFINEIDNSQRVDVEGPMGPVIVGRTERGPALRPVKVRSFSEYVEIFGNPIPGGQGGDVWRDGNRTAPTYAAYAAQAWLQNNSPATIVRLLGREHTDRTTTGRAGWMTYNSNVSPSIANRAATSNGGAFGLFVFEGTATEHGNVASTTITISNAVVMDTDTIVITTTDGTIITAKAFNTGSTTATDSNTPTFKVSFGADASDRNLTATNLATCLDANSKLTATAADAVVTVTQVLGGDSGNTTTVFNDGPGVGAGVGTTGGIFTGGGGQYKTHPTGALGAIFYVNQGAVGLTGSSAGDGGPVGGTGVWAKSVGTGISFKMEVTGASQNSNDPGTKTHTFSFSETSPHYIRKVFNTNPTLTNTNVTDETPPESYWLGETFDGHLKQYVSGTSAGSSYAAILPLSNATAGAYGGDLRKSTQSAQSGWYFSQDLGSNYASYDPTKMQKLFRFICLDTGEWDQRNIKISISEVKAPTSTEQPYGNFSVLIRKIEDTDNSVRVIERFSNCNLNPNSENFISKKIGDKYVVWSDIERRYTEYGSYFNRSNFIRVEVDEAVEKGNANSEYLPFGVHGPVRFKGFSFSGSYGPYKYDNTGSAETNTFVSGALSVANFFGTTFYDGHKGTDGQYILALTSSQGEPTGSADGPYMSGFAGAIKFPEIRLRASSKEGTLANSKDAYFGADTTYKSLKFDKSVIDVLKPKPYGIDDFTPGSTTEYSWTFSLDNLKLEDSDEDSTPGAPSSSFALYHKDYRTQGTSLTAKSGSYATANWKNVLTRGFNRFTTVLHGGCNGLDISEREPFRNTILDEDGTTEVTSYEFNSIKMALDSIADPEIVEFDTLLCPGVTNPSINSHMMKICEDRGDALAIVDLAGGYQPDAESTDTEAARLGDVTTTIDNLHGYGWNSSYACTYYPWVQIRDNINGSTLWCPSSVVALGAMSFGQASSELWFAPAGFTRGGLSEGAAGIPVVGVRQRLTSKERDQLYDANINPIATFPAEGIVIFGQKTLQITPSALDRINVRRLLIYLKKQISRMAATILFDQNVKVTWNRFRGQVEPFLASVQARLGLREWKVVLDETTTTPDLIDRNIMYAKIFLKPTQAIEFIALDFVITDSGASFED